VLALHADVVVCVSGIWQTTCTVVHSGDETFVVDSPVLPEELEALPSVLAQAGWELTGLLATHGDWDHLLGRLTWPDAPLGVAESTAARLAGEPGAAQRKLRDFDREHYVERPRPLALGHLQSLPEPGRVEVGASELELHPADGHTTDGMAIAVPWAGVLVCGDYLSPVEAPMVGAGAAAYRATLERLRPLVEAAEWVVPGHGAPLSSGRALEILEAHLAHPDVAGSADADASPGGAAGDAPPGRAPDAPRRGAAP
jgi:glyoxylase-like metal-dependent hydrolase (beta-lactamase superfamily II)